MHIEGCGSDLSTTSTFLSLYFDELRYAEFLSTCEVDVRHDVFQLLPQYIEVQGTVPCATLVQKPTSKNPLVFC